MLRDTLPYILLLSDVQRQEEHTFSLCVPTTLTCHTVISISAWDCSTSGSPLERSEQQKSAEPSTSEAGGPKPRGWQGPAPLMPPGQAPSCLPWPLLTLALLGPHEQHHKASLPPVCLFVNVSHQPKDTGRWLGLECTFLGLTASLSDEEGCLQLSRFSAVTHISTVTRGRLAQAHGAAPHGREGLPGSAVLLCYRNTKELGNLWDLPLPPIRLRPWAPDRRQEGRAQR